MVPVKFNIYIRVGFRVGIRVPWSLHGSIGRDKYAMSFPRTEKSDRTDYCYLNSSSKCNWRKLLNFRKKKERNMIYGKYPKTDKRVVVNLKLICVKCYILMIVYHFTYLKTPRFCYLFLLQQIIDIHAYLCNLRVSFLSFNCLLKQISTACNLYVVHKEIINFVALLKWLIKWLRRSLYIHKNP